MSDHEHDRRSSTGSVAGATTSAGVPGKRSLVESRYGVQRKARTTATDAPLAPVEIAARGVDGPGERLPFMDVIQKSAARDLGGIEAHVGGPAAAACAELGATAYATGNKVAFASPPDLHTATHEAAHVLQQRAGVQLKGGIGEAGDEHERQADAAGDAIVAGQSIAPHLPAVDASGGGAAIGVQMQKGGGKSKAPKGATPLVVHVFHKGGKVTTWRGVTDLDDLKGHAFYGGEGEDGAWHWNSPLGDEIDLYKDEADRTPTPITSLARRPSVEFISIHIGATDTEVPDHDLVAQMSGVGTKKSKQKRTGPIDPDRTFFGDAAKADTAQSHDQRGAKGGDDDGVIDGAGRRHRTGGGQHITGDANDASSSGVDPDAALAGDSQGQRSGLVLDKSGAIVGRKTGPKGGASGNTHDTGKAGGRRDGVDADKASIVHNPEAEMGPGPGGNIPEDGGSRDGMAGGENGGKSGGAPIGMGIWEVLTLSGTAARTVYIADLITSADFDSAIDKLVKAAGKKIGKKLFKKQFLKKAIAAQVKKLADSGMSRIEERLADVADWQALDDTTKNHLRARWRYELEDEVHRRMDRELSARIDELQDVVKDGQHMAKELGSDGDDYLDELVRGYSDELADTKRTRETLREIERPQGTSSFKKLDERLEDDVRAATEWAAVSQFWPQRTSFDGMTVYRRNDLFDPHLITDDGRTNLARMRDGNAPIGTDGSPIEVHHLNQSNDGPVVEILADFHDRHHRTIHINGNDIPSGIDRPGFENWRRRYWTNRANEIEPKPVRRRRRGEAPGEE